MGLSFEQAIAAVAAPGQPFEVIQDTREGVTNRIFKNAPATMRDFFDLAREVDATFLVYEDEEWSFREVMEEVDALANALVGTYGVKVGDRVGIAMRNLPEWVVAFAAILSIGAVSVSLNAWWTEDEIDFAVKDSSLSVLIADTDRISRAQGPCQRESVAIIGVRLDELEPLGVNVKSWNDVVIRGVAMPVVALTPDDDATILYTSGTTGFPKGAVSTHRALCQTVLAFSSGAAIVEARRDAAEAGSGLAPCFILIVPLFHVTGCIPVMMSCFAWQFKLVMMHRWDPERALQLIERHRVTNFVGVPTQSWDLVECPNFARYDTRDRKSVV